MVTNRGFDKKDIPLLSPLCTQAISNGPAVPGDILQSVDQAGRMNIR